MCYISPMRSDWRVGETRFLGLTSRPALVVAAVMACGACVMIALLATGVIPLLPIGGLILGLFFAAVLFPVFLFPPFYRWPFGSSYHVPDDRPQRR